MPRGHCLCFLVLGKAEAGRGVLTHPSSHHWHRGPHQPVGQSPASFPSPLPPANPALNSAQPSPMPSGCSQHKASSGSAFCRVGYAERAEGGGSPSPWQMQPFGAFSFLQILKYHLLIA